MIRLRLLSLLLVALATMALPAQGWARQFVVTIDAGHGGKDYGAVGAQTNEKTINLAVAKALGALIEKNISDKDVKVVYTRTDDSFVELQERAAIANRACSDLFVSIHVNSVAKSNRNRASIHGCQVYTLGLHKTAENLAVARRENAVMELEPDATARYVGFDPESDENDIIFELTQNKRLEQSVEFADAAHTELALTAGRDPKGVRQAGFWVLWATSMPSVLVELDFICCPESEGFMSSAQGQERLATSLYNAFCGYLNTYGSLLTGQDMALASRIELPPMPKSQPDLAMASQAQPAQAVAVAGTPSPGPRGGADAPQVGFAKADPDKKMWRIQVLASSAPVDTSQGPLGDLPDVGSYHDGGLWKYTTGAFTSAKSAQKSLRKLRKQFPQAFIIETLGQERVGFIKN